MTLSIPVVNGEECSALASVEPENHLGGFETHTYTVPCRRLDDFNLDSAAVIKIDAEGHELSVLEGARGQIARDKSAVFIEVEERHKPDGVRKVAQFFDSLGYHGFFLLGRSLRPIAEFEPARYQNPSHVVGSQVLFGHVYVNNFIFVSRPDQIQRLERLVRAKTAL